MADSNTTSFVYNVNPAFQSLNSSQINDLANSTSADTVQFDNDADRSITTYNFPADLFSNPNRASHVLQININENKIKDIGTLAGSTLSGIGTAAADSAAMIVNATTGDKTPTVNPLAGFGVSRMKGAIFLYMPSSVTFSNTNQYSDVSLTNLVEKTAGDTLFTAVASQLSKFGEALGITHVAGDLVNASGDLAALGGLPINPKIEVLFQTTTQRGFQFDFLFAPSTPQETDTLYNIIKTLRREAAPVSVSGIFWRAPSTFNLSFLHNGVENAALPKIQECVLEQIDIDMAPSGNWSTFKNGYPTQVRMQLRFRERWPNDQTNIDAGY